jgi:hypothetical protein
MKSSTGSKAPSDNLQALSEVFKDTPLSAPRQLIHAKTLMDEEIEVSSIPVYQVLRQAQVAVRRGLAAPELNNL